MLKELQKTTPEAAAKTMLMCLQRKARQEEKKKQNL